MLIRIVEVGSLIRLKVKMPNLIYYAAQHLAELEYKSGFENPQEI